MNPIIKLSDNAATRIKEIIDMTNIFLDWLFFVANILGRKTIKEKHIIVKIIWDGLEKLKSFIYLEYELFFTVMPASFRNLILHKDFECQ